MNNFSFNAVVSCSMENESRAISGVMVVCGGFLGVCRDHSHAPSWSLPPAGRWVTEICKKVMLIVTGFVVKSVW